MSPECKTSPSSGMCLLPATLMRAPMNLLLLVAPKMRPWALTVPHSLIKQILEQQRGSGQGRGRQLLGGRSLGLGGTCQGSPRALAGAGPLASPRGASHHSAGPPAGLSVLLLGPSLTPAACLISPFLDQESPTAHPQASDCSPPPPVIRAGCSALQGDPRTPLPEDRIRCVRVHSTAAKTSQ